MQVKAVMAKTVGQLECHPDKEAKCFVWNTGYQLRHTLPKILQTIKGTILCVSVCVCVCGNNEILYNSVDVNVHICLTFASL